MEKETCGCERNAPKCPYCKVVNFRWHTRQRWLGIFRGNQGAFIEIECYACKEKFVGWLGRLWFNTYKREEAQDITA